MRPDPWCRLTAAVLLRALRDVWKDPAAVSWLHEYGFHLARELGIPEYHLREFTPETLTGEPWRMLMHPPSSKLHQRRQNEATRCA
jgi:hypothetical protein